MNIITNIGLLFDNNTGRAPFIEYTAQEIENDKQVYESFCNTISSQNYLINESNLIEINENSDKDYDKIVKTNTPLCGYCGWARKTKCSSHF